MTLLLQAFQASEAIASPIYNQVTERIVRQLLESLLYERVIQPRTERVGEKLVFILEGKDASGSKVEYRCVGREAMTFGRIRLDRHSVSRMARGSEEMELQPGQLLFELLSWRGQPPDENKLRAMAGELEQTRLKDVLAQYERSVSPRRLNGLSYDELENGVMEGHPYHPCYKSRIGFHYEDNYAYGPEYNQSIRPLWVAMAESIGKAAIMEEMSFEQLLHRELGDAQIAAFREKLIQADCDPDRYVWLPVHPWQWRNKIVPVFIDELHAKQLVLLGSGTDAYRAQQSIRTLSNADNRSKSSIKLSLHIRNTSSVRSLTPHSVVSAPAVSGWLSQLTQADPYLKEKSRVIILKEFAGVTFEAEGERRSDNPLEQERYGALGCIWRESIHTYLEIEEQAVPFHALYALEADQKPFIDPWIEQHGIDNWLAHLLEAAVLPVVHLLVMHGIALESHAQNMILVHKYGLPVRVALKDFHEGVEFCADGVSTLVPPPDFGEIHAAYAQGKLNDYYEMKDRASLVAMTLDALFMINLGELALMLSDKYGYREQTFWRLVAEVLHAHKERYPEQKDRFEKFDLYPQSCPVEQLAGSRLQAEAIEHCHTVANPLFAAKEELALALANQAAAAEPNREELLSYAAGQPK